MSSVNRQVTGPTLSFALDDEVRRLNDGLTASTTRTARTLVKDGPLRVTLVAVKPGGELRSHRADGPITLQVLAGEIELHTGSRFWTLPAGSLFALDAGLTHNVRAPAGGTFLLTVVGAAGEEPET